MTIISNKAKEYCFVLDINNNKLSPCNTNKAWYLIRKQKAILINKNPMVIQLNYEVKSNNHTDFIVGIDIGSIYTGIAIVQKCKTKNKPVFKGTIEHRQDVKHLMDVRRGYRNYHRFHKRYRKVRFNNRSSSKRINRIAPSILQKKQSVIRVVNGLSKYINIDKLYLEDVAIDIRALTEGYKPYKWQYQKSNRLDENIRKAIMLRDNNTCQMCGKTDCRLESHHITPRRLKGSNNIGNQIALCEKCHKKVTGREMEFAEKLYEKIKGRSIRFDFATHTMQGKNWLRNELNKIAEIRLTTGGYTSNKRIDWDIDKSHSNDAIVITDLLVNKKDCDIKDWIIKPMRRKSKATVESVGGLKHRDLIKYTKKNGEVYIGYITALYEEKKQCNITTIEGKVLKRYGIKSCKLLWRFNKIYWF